MSVSDVIQIGSFVSELIGLTLTVVGILDKSRMAKIESGIVRVIEKRDFYWYKYNKWAARAFGAYLLISLLLIAIGQFINETFFAFTLVMFLAVTFITMTFGQLRRIFPNHQILLLGLSISALSLLGEFYQVCMIFR